MANLIKNIFHIYPPLSIASISPPRLFCIINSIYSCLTHLSLKLIEIRQVYALYYYNSTIIKIVQPVAAFLFVCFHFLHASLDILDKKYV